jgi:nucleotide-binding universal stress UspA family protein
MYERILIPLDGSKVAQRAIPFAVCLPARAVRLLRVELESAELGPGPPIDFEPDWREVRTAQVREELTPVGNQLRESGATVELAVEFCNDAAAAIMAAAADVELIVMTTRGRGGAGRALLGSVADRVVRHATTPILLVRAARRAVSPVMTTRIVVPLDGSPRRRFRSQ